MAADINNAFDDAGNLVSRVIVNTIAPIAHAEEARQIAAGCLNLSPGVNAVPAEMLTTLLRPIGATTPTHVWCSRACHTHGLNQQIDYFQDHPAEWVLGRLYSIDDDTDDILSGFATIVGPADAALAALGLEVAT